MVWATVKSALFSPRDVTAQPALADTMSTDSGVLGVTTPVRLSDVVR
jgi:hypothetical protein